MIFSFFKLSRENIAQAIFKASIINLFTKFFGYLRQVIIATFIGFNLNTDAFFLAFSLLGLFLIFTEILDSLGIPKLVSAKKESLIKFRKIASSLFTFTLVSTLIVIPLAILFIYLFTYLILSNNPSKALLTREYFFLLIPFLISSFLFHYLGTIHRALRHFTVYFLSELIFSIIAFLLTLIGLIFTKNPKTIPIALSLAKIFSTIYTLLLSKPYFKYNFKIDCNVKKFFKTYLKLTFVYSVFYTIALIDKIFASFLPPKNISALTYGWMLALIPKGILRLENILITKFSEIELNIKVLNYYLFRIFLLNLFTSFLLLGFSPIVISLLFSYGNFSQIDKYLTVLATKYYSLGAPFIILWEIIYRIFQINGKILLLVPISLLVIGTNIFFNYILLFKGHLGLIGICIATDISYLIGVSLGYWFLWKLYHS